MKPALTVIFCASLLVASCGSRGPSCSENRVLDLIRKIAKRELAKDAQLQYVFDAEKTRYEIDSIRTVTSTDNKCECEASLKFVFELNDQLKHIRDTDQATWQSMISNNFQEAKLKEISKDITYTGQLTDDGKQVYVKITKF